MKKIHTALLLAASVVTSTQALAVEKDQSFLSIGMVATQNLIQDSSFAMGNGNDSQDFSSISDPTGFNVKWRSTDRNEDWGIIYSITGSKDSKNLSFNVTDPETGADNETEADIRIQYLNLSAGPTYTFGDLAVYTMVGISRLEIEQKMEESSFKKNDIGISLGAGLAYRFSKYFEVDAHIEFPDVSLDVVDSNKAVAAVGIGFLF